MENQMFCFQCEQTAGCTGCTKNTGVCGKKSTTARLQDELVGALIGLARAVEQNSPTEETDELMMGGLFATLTNVNFNDDTLRDWIRRSMRRKMRWPRTVPCAESLWPQRGLRSGKAVDGQ